MNKYLKQIEQAKKQRDQLIDSLFDVWQPTGEKVRKFDEETHNLRLASIHDAYADSMRSIISGSIADAGRSYSLLKRSKSRTMDLIESWDMERAQEQAPFVQEDINGCRDAGALLEYIQTNAGSFDKGRRWLILRYGRTARENLEDTDENLALVGDVDHALDELRDRLAGDDRLARENAWQREIGDAKEAIATANGQLPEQRQKFAESVGVNAEHLEPDLAFAPM